MKAEGGTENGAGATGSTSAGSNENTGCGESERRRTGEDESNKYHVGDALAATVVDTNGEREDTASDDEEEDSEAVDNENIKATDTKGDVDDAAEVAVASDEGLLGVGGAEGGLSVCVCSCSSRTSSSKGVRTSRNTERTCHDKYGKEGFGVILVKRTLGSVKL
jgi:hypothetical protein